MKATALALPLGLLVAFAASAHADIVGSSVTGSMNIGGNPPNYYDPVNGFVPAGYKNVAGTTVTIGPGIEFGYQDTANTDLTDFTSTGVTFTDTTAPVIGFTVGITYTFTDPAFTGFTLVSSDFAGLTYSFSGDTLQFTFPETNFLGTDSIVFAYTSPTPPTPGVTPEPGSLALLGTGALGVLGTLRRRRLA